MYEFKFADVGEGITEGELVKWKIKEGDKVKEDQVIAEIETDKAVVEIPSPKSGKVVKLHHKQGDTIKVGETLVTIDDGSGGDKHLEAVPTPVKSKAASKTHKSKASKADVSKNKAVPKATEERKSVGVVGELEEAVEEIPIKVAPTQKEIEKHVEALPAVRRLAKELGVDITNVSGTGKGGRITESDIRTSGKPLPKAKITKKYDLYGMVERTELKGVRKAIAKNMVESVRRSVHVTHTETADVTHLWEIREKHKYYKKGVHLTFLPFIVKSVVEALEKHPYVNSTLDEEHEEIVLKKYYNIGIAVDTEVGLIVPVIKAADKKGILDIAKEIEVLSDKARTRKIDLGDLRGGTFTITNVGSIGGIFATPIINQPEIAILALGRIYEAPVVVEGKIVVRKVLPLSFTFDHRVIDGAEAARFTNTLKEYLEDPDRFIMK